MRGFGVETLAEMRRPRMALRDGWEDGFVLCGALRCGWEAQEWAAGWLADGGTFSRRAAVGKTWGASIDHIPLSRQGNGARQRMTL